MLLKNLEYLVALSRERHFARAAATCQVTQPTLSAGIKQLEEEMGVLIVERGQRFQGLTPEGERILAWAYRILGDFESMSQEVSELRGGLVGRLRVGAIPVMQAMISLLTGPFAERHSRVSISVFSHSSLEIQRGLDAFELDVGLTYLDNEPLSRVRTHPLYRERYVLLTPATGPLAARTEVTWREAASLPLCLLTRDMQNRRIVDGHFSASGAAPRPAVEANSIDTLCSHVREGNWSTVLPHATLYVFGALPGVRVIPLVEPDASQELGLIVPDRQPLTPVARAFLDVAKTLDVQRIIDEQVAEWSLEPGSWDGDRGQLATHVGHRRSP
jgi:DNA-binding transcriptional LysR family regulator